MKKGSFEKEIVDLKERAQFRISADSVIHAKWIIDTQDMVFLAFDNP